MSKQKQEQRGYQQEIRADGEGIFEGYIAVWNTVDSYQSTFKRGAFKKTIQERFDKIKILWNHDSDEVIGKVTDIREDDHGVFVRGQLVTTVVRAAEVFELLKASAIDTLSFGFRTVTEKWEDGVRAITEVKLYEVSPVTFEANENAVITGVRSTVFQETIDESMLRSMGWRLIDSIAETLDDVWWEGSPEERMALFDAALADFRIAYLSWAADAMAFGMRRNASNELATAVREYLDAESSSPAKLAAATDFTQQEVRDMANGKPITARNKLTALPEEIQVAHQLVRSKAAEALCSELRDGILPAEAVRIANLVARSLPQDASSVGAEEMVTYLAEFRKKLTQEK